MNAQTALLAIAVAALAGAAPVFAAVPALLCDGCTSAQEEQRALGEMNSGYLFVYNVTDNRIRKFEVETKAIATSAAQAKEKAATRGAVKITSMAVPGVASTKRNLTRELWEHPVDPSARDIFDKIVHTEKKSPGVAVQGREHTQDRKDSDPATNR